MKKLILILVPLLLVGGGVVGAAMMGVISIPGLSPAKKKALAASLYAEKEEKPVVKKSPPSSSEEKSTEPNLEKGRLELAQLWNELEPAVIVGIVEKWSDEDLARQLRYVETEKTASVVALLKPDRASKVCKILQVLGNEKKAGSA